MSHTKIKKRKKNKLKTVFVSVERKKSRLALQSNAFSYIAFPLIVIGPALACDLEMKRIKNHCCCNIDLLHKNITCKPTIIYSTAHHDTRMLVFSQKKKDKRDKHTYIRFYSINSKHVVVPTYEGRI